MGQMHAQSTPGSPGRLEGLDLARFFAFAGMVLVNFKIVMGAEGGEGLLHWLSLLVEGKAAASFVVLAGLGAGLAYARFGDNLIGTTLKRGAFLLVLGLVNMLIFPADILHYYAFYFLFGAVVLSQSTALLVSAMVALNIGFVALVFVLNYDAGWNWLDYSYVDFWTPAGFVRNLMFNGWHPVIPWFGFFLFGVVLSRIELSARRVQLLMIGTGIALVATMTLVSGVLAEILAGLHPELSPLATTLPVPPGPLFSITGMASASVLIGLCVWVADHLGSGGFLGVLMATGRQTLTLYVAHIVVGMGLLEAFGLAGGQTAAGATLAAFAFCVVACIYAAGWARLRPRGPLEALMRKVAG
eukprot:jgi/Tetstr1/451117/TSEL_038153.t1